MSRSCISHCFQNEALLQKTSLTDDRISKRGKISLFKGKWESCILRWQMAVLGCEHRCQWNTFNLRREHGAPVWSLQMHFAKKRKCICSSEKYAIGSHFLTFLIHSICITIVDVMSAPYVILLVLGYYVFWGMQGCTICASLAAWLWENGERMRKWRGNGERMRK